MKKFLLSAETSTNPRLDPPFLRTGILTALRVFVALLGALASWTARYMPNADAVSYVDISDHYLAGNWPFSGSGYWSPLFPSLIALARLVGGRDIRDAWLVAHGLNFLIFLGALVAMEWFVRAVRDAMRETVGGDDGRLFTWQVLVYLLFAWTTISWVTLWLLTPDMCVALLVFVGAGLAVRIAHGRDSRSNWVALGAVLGLGYLAKTALLPIGVVVLVTVGASVARRRGPWRRVGWAMVALFALCLPQVTYVSNLKGTFTIGDVGRLAHAWYSAGIPSPLGDAGTGALPAALPSPNGSSQTVRPLDPLHDDHPMVYNVDGPFPGTLPIWYDATYWYRNVHVPLAVVPTIKNAIRYALSQLWLFSPFVVVLIVGVLRCRSRMQVARLPMESTVVVPSGCALAMYALSYSEARYLAPFAVLLLAGLVSPLGPDTPLSKYIRQGFVVAALPLFGWSLLTTVSAFKEREPYERLYAERLALVAHLNALGLGPGTKIGYVGNPYTAYWPQLAQLRIVSVVPGPEVKAFWEAPPERRDEVLRRMRAHGAAAILARRADDVIPDNQNWMRVSSDSLHFIHRATDQPGRRSQHHDPDSQR